jgi:hypothetical protein
MNGPLSSDDLPRPAGMTGPWAGGGLRAVESHQLRQRAPAQSTRTTHLHHETQARLPGAQRHQRGEFGPRKHLSLQQPHHNRSIALKEWTELGHHTLNFTHGCPPPNALVAQVGRPDAMELKKVGLRISEATGRGDLGAITGSSEPPQQTGLGTTFKGGIKSQGSGLLQLLAETAACQQEGHRAVTKLWQF